MSDLSLTDASVRAAVDAEAAGDDAFRARLVTGAATKGEMRTRLAARLSTEEVNLKPFKAAMIDAMMRHYTEKDAAAAPAAPAPAAPAPEPDEPDVVSSILRGTASLDDGGKLVWSGHWAFSKEAWAAGDKSRFKLTSAKRLGKKGADRSGGPGSLLVDGKWLDFNGHFFMDVVKAGGAKESVKEKEKSVKMRFKKKDGGAGGWWNVDGRGKNKFGAWTFSRSLYNAENKKLMATRDYAKPLDELGTSALLKAPLDDDDDDDDDFDGDKAADGDDDDDDDDDDDEEEEEELASGAVDAPRKKKKSDALVQLRGSLERRGDGAWVWRGKWAANRAALDAGDDGDFSLVGKESSKRAESLKSLDLSGTFDLRSPPGDGGGAAATRAVPEPILTLHFGEGAASRPVDGRGRNEFGSFRVRGSYDPATGALECTKKYAVARPESDDDDDDGGGDGDDADMYEEIAELNKEALEFANTDLSGKLRESTKRAELKLQKKRQRDELGSRRRAEAESREAKRGRPSGGSLLAWGEADLADETARLKAAVAADDEATIVRHLRNLHAKSLSTDLLSKTGIGKVVGGLRKHDSAKVKAMAGALVKKWKAMVSASQ